MQGQDVEDGSPHAAHSSSTIDEEGEDDVEDEDDEDDEDDQDDEEEDGEEFANSKELSSLITSQAINSSTNAARGATLDATIMGKSDGVDAHVKSKAKETGGNPPTSDPTDATSGNKRDLSGIVMDVVILGAPLCSKVSWQLGRTVQLTCTETHALFVCISFMLHSH